MNRLCINPSEGRLGRDSNIELLRIVSTILITINHIPCSDHALEINRFIKYFFFYYGQLGVSVYVIVGGVFLYKKDFDFKRIYFIIQKVFFYGLLLTIIDIICFGVGCTWKNILRGFSYWFPFGYVISLLVFPIIFMINRKCRIIITIISMSSVTMITLLNIFLGEPNVLRIFNKGLFIGPVWFCILFIVSSLIAENDTKNTWKPWFAVILFLLSIIIMDCVEYNWNKDVGTVLYRLISPTIFLASISLYLIFRHINIGINTNMNKLASHTFGMYLFQCHVFTRPLIYDRFFRFEYLSEKSYLYFAIALILVIFVFCMTVILDKLEHYLFSLKYFVFLQDKICNFVNEWYRNRSFYRNYK